MKGKTRRELFRLLWGRRVNGSVSTLARAAGVSFAAAHRELEAMRVAGLATSRRVGNELRYRATDGHPRSALLSELAGVGDDDANAAEKGDARVRSWLVDAGAPLAGPAPEHPTPSLEVVLAEGVALSHRDATVARVLPVVLWNRRHDLALELLMLEAKRRDEHHALGYFLELAGRFGHDASLVEAAQALNDGRRRRTRLFFVGPHGRYQRDATRRNTPPEAKRWGFLMNVGLDSFQSTFDKHAQRP